jgi:hypothetical protein
MTQWRRNILTSDRCVILSPGEDSSTVVPTRRNWEQLQFENRDDNCQRIQESVTKVTICSGLQISVNDLLHFKMPTDSISHPKTLGNWCNISINLSSI